jgi:hypothetical protein
MRRALLIALAASLTLGTAPPGSAVLECRLPYGKAIAALNRLHVTDRFDITSQDGYSHMRLFDAARITAFGSRVNAFNTVKLDAISHESLTVTVILRSSLAAVREAALKSRGKTECANREGPPGYCDIDERDDGGWTVSFALENKDGRPTLTCLYTRPSA